MAEGSLAELLPVGLALLKPAVVKKWNATATAVAFKTAKAVLLPHDCASSQS